MCWHKWGKWVDTEGTLSNDDRPALLQIRYCEKCNKKKFRKIMAGVL